MQHGDALFGLGRGGEKVGQVELGQGFEMGADAACRQDARQGQRDIANRMKKFRQGHIGWIER